jgi:hypothetical protein
MNKQKRGTFCLVCLLFLLTAGCQAVQRQAIAPETVIEEGKETCTFALMTPLHPGKIVPDPELGNVTYGHVFTYHYDCGSPYLSGICVSVIDYWGEWDKESSSGIVECLTTEDGVWKGTSQSDGGENIQHAYLGEGKYKGLKLTFVFDATDSIVDYRVTRVNEQ